MLSPSVHTHKPSSKVYGCEIIKLRESPKASTTVISWRQLVHTMGNAHGYGNNVDDVTMDNLQRSLSLRGTFRDYNGSVTD